MIDKTFFMLCQSTTKECLNQFSEQENFKANIKYDGERIIAVKKGNDVFLINRRSVDKGKTYPEITESLKCLDFDFIIDGEVITENGLFNSLQHRSNLKDKGKIAQQTIENPVLFMIFDILNFNNADLRMKPLKERISYGFYFDKLKRVKMVDYKEVKEVYDYAFINNLEGIIIKDMNSTYEHRRSDKWLKLKNFKEICVKVVRYSVNPKGIRAECENLWAVQIAGEQSKAVKKDIDEKGYCDIIIQYLETTKDGMLRFPSFKEIANETAITI